MAIDWKNIKITIYPADKEEANPKNPLAFLSKEERRRNIQSIYGKIYLRLLAKRDLEKNKLI